MKKFLLAVLVALRFSSAAQTTSDTIIFFDDAWKYWIGTSNPDTNWRNLSFSDLSWPKGPGGFGYGDGDDNTVVPFGTLSVMIRKTFTVYDTSQVLSAVFTMDYDDGFVAFLNGVEIARANLGTIGDRPNYAVPASSQHEANVYQGGLPDVFYLTYAQLHPLLVQGTNVLAVQVHNYNSSSSDLSAIPCLYLDVPDGISSLNAEQLQINNYPNPFAAYIKLVVRSAKKIPYSLVVFNSAGQIMETHNGLKTGEPFIFGSTLTAGVYFELIQQGDEKRWQRIVKIH